MIEKKNRSITSEQKEELMKSLEGLKGKNLQAKCSELITKWDSKLKGVSLAQLYYQSKRKDNPVKNLQTIRKSYPTQVPQSELPVGFMLMQTILGSTDIKLSKNSKVIISQNELTIQF